MPETTVIAHVRAKTGQQEVVGAELEKLLIPTRSEPGCIRYDMFVDANDPAHFVFIETWESIDAHHVHLEQGHMEGFLMACKGTIAEATFYHLENR
ncbi:putative quinol monooxygenase [Congregibacter variabilis]|uniref:Quinol monooxygenase n=1 Tax=Congregibacter variabilis TaxID=3081200 RepID=A0ABZ0I6H8_9GAMM|nr:putative quinol monooxygenase [Congregibacter sp. IMCC43200]